MFYPTTSVAYAIQARDWLERARQAEIDEGLINEKQAMEIATRLMSRNQQECFDLEGTRRAIAEAMAT